MNEIYAAGPHVIEADIEIVADAMRKWYGKDAYYYCELFQEEFASYHDRRFGIMTPNCTSALRLLLDGLGIGPGDEVLVPECTWIGSTAGINEQGAQTVFCDIDSTTWCIDPDSVRKSVTARTKAIIAVNLYGNMADMVELQKIADEHGLFLIEDAAESLGSILNGVKSGKFGVGSTFSFHRTKTLTTGEGGMLILDDEDLWDRCMFLRDHGRSRTIPYYVEEVAYKYMPFNVQAALGYAQFQRLDELLDIKRSHFLHYKRELGDIPGVHMNPEQDGVVNGYWITTLVLDGCENRSELLSNLHSMGIPARPFFYPLSSMPAYAQGDKYRLKNCVAYDVSPRGINLPGAMNMTEDQLQFVCDGVKNVIRTS